MIDFMTSRPEWVRVPGFSHIEVTRDGRVRTAAYEVTRLSRHGTVATYAFKPREMRVWLSDTGYLRCVVQRDGKRGPIYHHRLIAMAFVQGYADGYHVNHINGNKVDNRPENLEWLPPAANNKHAVETGLIDLRGELNPMAALTPSRVKAIRKALALGVAPTTISKIAGMSHSTILSIRDGKSWRNLHG